jgi:ADP-ribose pyrophosphatase
MNIESHTITHHGLQLDVAVDRVTVGGELLVRETVLRPNAVVMVGGTTPDKFMLVQQYRHAMGQFTIELPAGKIDADEDPRLAAIREFAEETGLLFADATFLGGFYPSAGYSNEYIYAYRMDTLVQTGCEGIEGEISDVFQHDRREWKQFFRTCQDAKTKIALAMAFGEIP